MSEIHFFPNSKLLKSLSNIFLIQTPDNICAKKNDLNYSSIDVEAKETYKFDYPTQHGSIQIPISSLIKTLEN